MIIALKADWHETLPVAICLLLFPIPYYITHSALRYRHPIDPFITIFAAYAVGGLWSAAVSKRDNAAVPISRPVAASAKISARRVNDLHEWLP
jgi:hypothetical protein